MIYLFAKGPDSPSFMREIFTASTSRQSLSRTRDAGLVWRRIAAEDPRARPCSLSSVIDRPLRIVFSPSSAPEIDLLVFRTFPVPKAYKRPEFVEELRALLTEAGTVSLECKVVGIPTPVLRWFKDSKEIKAGDVFALTANPDDPTSLGVYTCEAVNCMGTAYSSSKVNCDSLLRFRRIILLNIHQTHRGCFVSLLS